jgi:hypothetical protein
LRVSAVPCSGVFPVSSVLHTQDDVILTSEGGEERRGEKGRGKRKAGYEGELAPDETIQ